MRVPLKGALIALSALSKQFNNAFDFYIFCFFVRKSSPRFSDCFCAFCKYWFSKTAVFLDLQGAAVFIIDCIPL